MRPIFNSHCHLWRFFLAIIALTLITSCATEDFYCHTINEETVEIIDNHHDTKQITLSPADTLLIENYNSKKGILELTIPKYDKKIDLEETKLVSLDGVPMSEKMAAWEKRDTWEIVFGQMGLAYKKLEAYVLTKYDIKPSWGIMLGLALVTLFLTEAVKGLLEEDKPLAAKSIAVVTMIPVAIYCYLFMSHFSDISFSTPKDWSTMQKIGYYLMEVFEIIIITRGLIFISGSLESVSTSGKGWFFGIIALVIWMICAGWYGQLYATQMQYIFYGILGIALLADLIFHIKKPASIIFAMLGTIFIFFNIVFIAALVIVLILFSIFGIERSDTESSKENEIEDKIYVDGKCFTKYKGDLVYRDDNGSGYQRVGYTLYNDRTGEKHNIQCR